MFKNLAKTGGGERGSSISPKIDAHYFRAINSELAEEKKVIAVADANADDDVVKQQQPENSFPALDGRPAGVDEIFKWKKIDKVMDK